jgi:hypothetical protein
MPKLRDAPWGGESMKDEIFWEEGETMDFRQYGGI